METTLAVEKGGAVFCPEFFWFGYHGQGPQDPRMKGYS